MPSIEDVARDFTAMLRAGQFEAAGNRYWADDVTSIEPEGRASVSGIDAARTKCHTRFGSAKIDEIGIDGPFVTGDQFALFLDLVIIDAVTGGHRPFSEIALYTVRDGRIAEERHFFD
jgi:limonene-1,2-epoxide hydrolase